MRAFGMRLGPPMRFATFHDRSAALSAGALAAGPSIMGLGGTLCAASVRPARHRMMIVSDKNVLELTADIVAAHLANNSVSSAEVPILIHSVFDALSSAAAPLPVERPRAEPAVSIRASIKPDYLVCLEDGAKLKMLKRYLRTNFDLSPEAYRAKWGLPADYPMVAPNYAETRRVLAHKIGLGRKPAAVQPTAKVIGRKRLGIAVAKEAGQQHLGTASIEGGVETGEG